MKALLIKELIYMKRNVILLMFITQWFCGIIYSFTVIPENGDSFRFLWIVIIAFFSGLWSVGFLNQERMHKVSETVAWMPISKETVVSSKYVCGIMGMVSSIIFTALSNFLRYLTAPQWLDETAIYFSFALTAIVFIVTAVCLPIAYRLGAISGVFTMLLFVGAVAGAVTGPFLDDKLNFGLSALIIIWIAAIVIYFISWRLSVNIYKKHGVRN